MKRFFILCLILIFTTLSAQAADNIIKLTPNKTYVLFLNEGVYSIINKSPQVLQANLIYNLNSEQSETILRPKTLGETLLSIKGAKKNYDFTIQVGGVEDFAGADIIELDEVK